MPGFARSLHLPALRGRISRDASWPKSGPGCVTHSIFDNRINKLRREKKFAHKRRDASRDASHRAGPPVPTGGPRPLRMIQVPPPYITRNGAGYSLERDVFRNRNLPVAGGKSASFLGLDNAIRMNRIGLILVR